jgi:hypothetical protein
MNYQSALNLKGDFNTEGIEDTEKTGKRKGRRKELSQMGAETQRAGRRSGFLASLGMTNLEDDGAWKFWRRVKRGPSRDSG